MAAGFFAAVVTLGILLAFVSGQVTSESRLLMSGAAALTAFQSVVRLTIGGRLPRWTLHIDIAIDILFGTIICLSDRLIDVEFSFYYLWAIMFVAIYFSQRVFLVYYTYMIIAFGIVARVPGAPPGIAEMSWPLAGTGLLLGLIILKLVSRLRYSGEVDSLTKLANRAAWENRTDEEFERAKRYSTSFSLVVIDVDDFKLVNDRFGHPAGDELLRTLAESWQKAIRGSGDFVARIGGDEFGYLAPGTGSREIDNVVGRLRSLVPLGMSCSFGVATWDGMSTLAELFRAADEAMYRAKRARKSGNRRD